MRLFPLWIFLGLLSWLLVGTIIVSLIYAWKPVLAVACILLLLKMLYGERRRRATGGW